jgi:hypothetical protein
MPAAAGAIRQVVLKPVGGDEGLASATIGGDESAASPAKWRPSRPAPLPPKVADKSAVEPAKKKIAAEAALSVKSAKAELATEVVE